MEAGPPDTCPQRTTTAPKLRASCDACGDAKVRCDRGRPTCRRCGELQVQCVYSVSRKHGRPPRRLLRVRMSSGGEAGSLAGLSRQQPGIPSAETEPSDGTSRDNGSTLGVFEPGLAGLGSDPALPLSGEQPDLSLDLLSPDWSPFSFMDAGLHMLPTGSQETEETSCTAHSCARESYEIFADLICPAPDLHAPQTNMATVPAQLDQVLHFNRRAIDRLGRLLACPCAQSVHRIMVHAATISRILIWYQQAAGWTCDLPTESSPADDVASSPSPSPPQDDASGCARPSARTLPQTTGFVVTSVPAALGTFGIEDEKIQATIRRHLVLSELGKMGSLIEMFTAQFTEISPVAGVVGHWLLNEYSRTVGALKTD